MQFDDLVRQVVLRVRTADLLGEQLLEPVPMPELREIPGEGAEVEELVAAIEAVRQLRVDERPVPRVPRILANPTVRRDPTSINIRKDCAFPTHPQFYEHF